MATHAKIDGQRPGEQLTVHDHSQGVTLDFTAPGAERRSLDLTHEQAVELVGVLIRNAMRRRGESDLTNRDDDARYSEPCRTTTSGA